MQAGYLSLVRLCRRNCRLEIFKFRKVKDLGDSGKARDLVLFCLQRIIRMAARCWMRGTLWSFTFIPNHHYILVIPKNYILVKSWSLYPSYILGMCIQHDTAPKLKLRAISVPEMESSAHIWWNKGPETIFGSSGINLYCFVDYLLKMLTWN